MRLTNVSARYRAKSKINEQAITQVGDDSSTHSKKRTASGDFLQKASKTQKLLSKEPHKAANNRLNKLEV